MTEKRKPMLLLMCTYPVQYVLLGPAGQLLLWGESGEADKYIQIVAEKFEAIHRLGGGVAIGNHCASDRPVQ